MEPYTGGPLNWLNGKAGTSAPNKSVSVMNLIKKHSPKSRAELVELIAFHAQEQCPCGIVSKGTVVDFGDNLFEAQTRIWGEIKYSRDVCRQWMYDLFVLQSLKGSRIEERAIVDVQGALGPSFAVESSDGFTDEETRVDLVVKHANQIIAGVQVKPNSYKFTRKAVQWKNQSAQSTFGAPVFPLQYEYGSEDWINLEQLCDSVRALAIA